ncbi:MAG: DoxX family protein [Acidobacteria bacterium]|nr:DoxX family protein [Acidobacteriota bacterium]
MKGRWMAIRYARLALGAAFLSAVAARFGLCFDRGPHPFAEFIRYTGEVNSFLPPATYPFLAVAATTAETLIGIALIVGFRVRQTALAAAILLAIFGTAMALSAGIKSPLDASVFSASACAWLLAQSFAGAASMPNSRAKIAESTKNAS